jgi:ABC-type multidrug transport system fused ATPase/permease subunit
LQVGITLLRPWPLALAVDHALGGKPLSGPLGFLAGMEPARLLLLAAAATVVLTTVDGLLDMATLRTAEGAAERIGTALRATMFERAMTRSLRWHDRMRSGELVSRLTTDVGRVMDGIVALTTSFLPDAVMLIGVLVLLLVFDPGLLAIGLAVVPLLAWLAVRQRARIRAAQQDARAESGRLAGASTDLLRNVRAVQAFGRIDYATEQFGRRNDQVLDVELRAIRVDARWTPVADVLLAVGAALVLVVGGMYVLNGSMTIGELLVVTAYLRNLYSPVRGLTRLSAVLAKAGASASRVQEVLDCDEAVTDRAGAWIAPPLVEDVRFENVAFRYEPGQPVLHDFTLRIAAGETVCLIGPSGVGKSTVLHLLLRLYEVDSGRVLIDGVDVRHCEQLAVRNQSRTCPRIRGCWTRRLPRTLPSATPRPPAPTCSRPAGPLRWTSSSAGCPMATTPPWARVAFGCPAASGAGSPLPARSSPRLRCCCWTSRRRRSTHGPPRPWSRPSGAPPGIAPC